MTVSIRVPGRHSQVMGPPRRGRIGDAILDNVGAGLALGGSVSSMAPIPMLEVAFQAASTMLSMVQNSRSNKNDIRELISEIVNYQDALMRKETSVLTDHTLYELQDFYDQLDRSLSILRELYDQALPTRLFFHQRIKKSILQCKGSLEAAFRKYSLHNQTFTSNYAEELYAVQKLNRMRRFVRHLECLVLFAFFTFILIIDLIW